MAKGIHIQVSGLDQVIKRLGQIPEDVLYEVDAEMSVAANDFVNRAVNDAPVDNGVLKNEITFRKEADLKYEVVSGAEYSAYIEFGTKSRVQVPADLQAYAAQFKSSGSSTGAKKAIFAWAKRVGIPEAAWYAVFVKIMTEGSKPHPFFFKQREPVMKALMKNIQPAIKSALNR